MHNLQLHNSFFSILFITSVNSTLILIQQKVAPTAKQKTRAEETVRCDLALGMMTKWKGVCACVLARVCVCVLLMTSA